MSLRLILGIACWFGVLAASARAILLSLQPFVYFPSMVCWIAYVVFCAISLSNAMMSSTRQRNIWTSISIFSLTGLITISWAYLSPEKIRTIGNALVLYLNVDYEPDVLYIDGHKHLRNFELAKILDLAVASIFTMFGALLGQYRMRTSTPNKTSE